MELTQEYTKKTITRNQVITHLGISMTCDEWADRLCVNVYTLISRLRRNPVNIALDTEVHTKGGKKYLVNNKYVTAKWMAEKADVSVTTIYKRMKLMPLDEVIGYQPPKTDISKFIVTMPNGQVFDNSKRKNPYIPKVLVWNCVDCGCFRYKRSDQRPIRCVSCNAKHGSNVRAEKSHIRVCCICSTTFQTNAPGGRKNVYCSKKCIKQSRCNDSHRHRAKRNGTDYVKGITTKRVAERDNMQCQLCGCKVVPHKGYKNGEYNPRWWSIGHIVAMNGPEKGAHTWENVQCECLECNFKKGIKSLGQLSMAL